MTATQNETNTPQTEKTGRKNGRAPASRLWLVTGEGETATWTEITALWPTKKGGGFTGMADKLLPIMANHMKGRLVILPAKRKAGSGGAQ